MNEVSAAVNTSVSYSNPNRRHAQLNVCMPYVCCVHLQDDLMDSPEVEAMLKGASHLKVGADCTDSSTSSSSSLCCGVLC
jgi:hypothetical protein